ncbi:5229_t:CDS:2, partial [Paraglomus occultum]
GGEEWTRVDAEGDEEMTEVERVGREKQKDKEKKGLGTNGCREGRLGEVEVALRSLEARKRGYGNVPLTKKPPHTNMFNTKRSLSKPTFFRLTNPIEIRELIISGDIPSALSLCQKKFPRVVSSAAGHEWTTPQSIEMCFKLHCQQFVEIVRAGETTEALSFAQEVLRPYTEIDVANEDKYASALRGVIPLIAYREPETSPVGSHLSQTCRDKLADDVNSAILSFYNLPSQSAIERIVRQSTVIRDNLHSESSTKDKRLSKIYQKWQFSSFIQEG